MFESRLIGLYTSWFPLSCHVCTLEKLVRRLGHLPILINGRPVHKFTSRWPIFTRSSSSVTSCKRVLLLILSTRIFRIVDQRVSSWIVCDATRLGDNSCDMRWTGRRVSYAIAIRVEITREVIGEGKKIGDQFCTV